MEPEPKLVTDYIHGYRLWELGVDNGILYALYANKIWKPYRELEAYCNVDSYIHDAPDPDCNCGIHARFSPNDLHDIVLQSRPGSILIAGAIAARGNIVMHERGFRAGCAKILGLAPPPEAVYRWTRSLTLSSEELMQAAGLYDVPCYHSMDALAKAIPPTHKPQIKYFKYIKPDLQAWRRAYMMAPMITPEQAHKLITDFGV